MFKSIVAALALASVALMLNVPLASANIYDHIKKNKANSIRAHANTPRETFKQIRQDLRDSGYRKIRFIDKNPPFYQVKACEKRRRFLLSFNRLGVLLNRERIGRCYRYNW